MKAAWASLTNSIEMYREIGTMFWNATVQERECQLRLNQGHPSCDDHSLMAFAKVMTALMFGLSSLRLLPYSQ